MTELETAQKRIAELEAELAAMRAGGEPVGYIITNTLVAGDRAIVFPDKADWAPKIFPRTPVYTHPQPAAQAGERKPLDKRQISDIYFEALGQARPALIDHGCIERFARLLERAHGIAAQQGDIHE